MRKIVYLIIVLLCASMACKAQVFWLENFTGLADGAQSDAGATAWTTTQPSTGTFAKATIVGQPVFIIDNTTTEGIWRSSVINISAMGEVALEVTLGANFAGATDYVRAFYILDGGPEIQFGETTGTPALVVSTAASTIVVGTNLQIVIRGKDTAAGVTAGIPNAVGFDDVSLTTIAVLYSRISGNWDNTATWSTGGFAGATCTCVPDDNSRVIIGNSRTVNMNVAGLVAGIDIQNTGILSWSVDNVSLTMRRGGTINVQTGGIMTNNSHTGTSIIFNAYAYLATVNGTLTAGTLTYNTGATFTVGGSGVLTAATVSAGMGTSRFITNNITGPGASFTVTGDISFIATNSALSILNNNGTLRANQILFDDDNVAFNNNGALTVTTNIQVNSVGDDNNKITNAAGATFSFSGIDTNLGNLLIDNSGTITQSGNFIEFDNGSLFRNLATGTWNWSLTPNTGFDVDLTGTPVLDLSAAGNTFNYNGAGAQNILPLTHSNLSVSNSGTKTRTASGVIDVNGNLLIQNTAILDISAPANTDLTLAGNWTVLNTASFTEGARTVTFDGGGTQVITNASGETFNNLTINTGATANTVQLANDITVSSVLTLTRGGLNINGNSVTLTNTAVGAISAAANGYILSETTTIPYSRVIWNTRTTVGTFTIPFRDVTSTAIPFVFNKTSAGTEAGTGSFSISTYHTAANNTPLPSTVTNVNRAGVDNSANVADRFWIIVPAGYSSNPNATVTFTVTPTEATGIANNTLRAQRWLSASSTWEAPIAGQTNPTAGTQAQVVVPATFSSVWTLSGNNLPLPIQLISFDARIDGDEVITSWKTAQEINNEIFTVQKTTDLEEFHDMGTVPGKGNSSEAHTYTLVDESPFTGKSYYRLKQTDFDGHFTFSDLVMVNYEGATSLSLKAFPNPFDGQRINIEVKGLKENSSIPVVIYNLQGQKLFEAIVTTTEGGFIKGLLDLNTVLPQGMYFIKAGAVEQVTRKIVVE